MATILLVDDDDLFRGVVKDTLTRAGHDVRDAANGEHAMRDFREYRPQLVVTDIFMPEHDGIELIQELRRVEPTVKIVAMSGHAGKVDFLRFAARLGAKRVLEKPFHEADLLEAVAEVLEGAEAD